MKWLSMITVMVVSATCITVAFWAARRTERTYMADRDRQALPELPETLSVLVDQQSRILELRSEGRRVQADPGPAIWQDLEPHYNIVSAHWIKDDEHRQIKLLQLRLQAKEQEQ
jgi:hypothetical protein